MSVSPLRKILCAASRLRSRGVVSSPRRSRLPFLILGILLLVCVGIMHFMHRRTQTNNRSPAEQSPDPRLTYDGPYLNLNPQVGYVGDQACSDCHVDRARTYKRHPMGRSTVPIQQL